MTAETLAPPILLLVEDDAALQDILEAGLQDEGFAVFVAPSGTNAIAELEASGTRFKAIVTDIRLGDGPNGWEVGHRGREIVPGIPMVYMSGDSAHEWTANGVPGSVMLQKPFVIAQLITALTTLLNQASLATALSDAMTADGNGISPTER